MRLVAEFAGTVPENRVVYRRYETNRGQGTARNTALAEARGELIALLDADDLWLETHLSTSLRTARQQNADVVFSTVVMFEDETGHILGVWGPTKREFAEFPESLFARNYITPSATVIRRTAFDTVGQFDTDPQVQGCEDVDFWLRAAGSQLRFAHVPGCHCFYRKGHPSAATSNMARLEPRHALVLERHGTTTFRARRAIRKPVSNYYTSAGCLHRQGDWRRALACYYRSWLWQPWRVDRFLLNIAFLLRHLWLRVWRTPGERGPGIEPCQR